MLGHYVFFSLYDSSTNATHALIAASQKYLANHEGIVFFAARLRTPDLNRDVNDQQFDVALQIVFLNRSTHDAYQESPKHHQFIDENRENWKQIRVFDIDIPNGPATTSS